MPSSKDIAFIIMSFDYPVTTSYGIGSAGWRTKEFDCRGLDEVMLLFKFTWGSAALITLKFEQSDGVNWYEVQKVGDDGSLSIEEITKAVTASVNFAFRYNTKACDAVRISAKVNAATAESLECRIIGEYGKEALPVLKVQ